jgi:hypothetical protein
MMRAAFLAALSGLMMATTPAFAGQLIEVPEPASMAVFAVGAVALAAARLRRRK